MQLTTISNKINHQRKCQRITIDKYSLILLLQRMSSWKHSLKCTPRNVAKRRPSYTEVVLASYVDVNNVFKRLYLPNPQLFLAPIFFLNLEFMSLIKNLLLFRFNFWQCHMLILPQRFGLLGYSLLECLKLFYEFVVMAAQVVVEGHARHWRDRVHGIDRWCLIKKLILLFKSII